MMIYPVYKWDIIPMHHRNTLWWFAAVCYCFRHLVWLTCDLWCFSIANCQITRGYYPVTRFLFGPRLGNLAIPRLYSMVNIYLSQHNSGFMRSSSMARSNRSDISRTLPFGKHMRRWTRKRLIKHGISIARLSCWMLPTVFSSPERRNPIPLGPANAHPIPVDREWVFRLRVSSRWTWLKNA